MSAQIQIEFWLRHWSLFGSKQIYPTDMHKSLTTSVKRRLVKSHKRPINIRFKQVVSARTNEWPATRCFIGHFPYSAIQSLMIFHGLFSQRRANGRFMSHSGVISLSASDPTPRTRRLAPPTTLPTTYIVIAVVTDILAMASGVTWPNLSQWGVGVGANLVALPPGFGLPKFSKRKNQRAGKPLAKLLLSPCSS